MGCVELETGIREDELGFRGSHGGTRAEEWTSAMVGVWNKMLYFFLLVARSKNEIALRFVLQWMFCFSPVSSDNPVCKHLLNYRCQQLCSLG